MATDERLEMGPLASGDAEPSADHAELLRRVQVAEATIAELRADALRRRAEVRELVRGLPSTVSRRSLLRSMLIDVARHPDKRGVATRAARKFARAPRRAARTVLRRR